MINALAPLLAAGWTPEQVALVAFGSFPVAGPAFYSDDWHAPRYTPTFHLHAGTDILTAFDTPVRAPFDGVLRYADEAVGGRSAYVTAPDGTFAYMTHLNGYVADLSSGTTVARGEVVGFAGDSGNAHGGAPHVHFEYHPGGGAPVNPKPILDRWLADALAAVPSVLASAGDAAGDDVAPPTPPAPAPVAAPQSAAWDRATIAAQVRDYAWRQATALAARLLDPLTPAALRRDVHDAD